MTTLKDAYAAFHNQFNIPSGSRVRTIDELRDRILEVGLTLEEIGDSGYLTEEAVEKLGVAWCWGDDDEFQGE